MSGLPLHLRLRRQEDARYEAAQRMVDEGKKTAGVVFFEHRTDAKIKDRLVAERIASQNKIVRARIDDRRAKLAALLEAEKIMYEREIEATFESPEQVKEKLFAHARSLKEESEARRKKLAEELEDRRFRLSSDVLRARASAITTERVALDRVGQLQERAKIAALVAEREAADAAAAASANKHFLDGEKAKIEARRRIAAEYAEMLQQQEAAARDIKGASKTVDSVEVTRMLDADTAAAAARRQAEIDRRTAAREEYERVQAYNAHERGIKGAAAAAEAAADKASLDAKLKQEAAEAAAEREAALERRRAGVEFKKTLESQMAIQSEDKGWMDRFYAEESEKEWVKRQAKWDAEAAARKGLLDEVTTGRQAQMQDRGRQGELERMRDAAQMESFRQMREREETKEAEKQSNRTQKLVVQSQLLKQQLDENAAARDRAKQEEYLEWRLAQKFEKQYEARVQALLASQSAGSR